MESINPELRALVDKLVEEKTAALQAELDEYRKNDVTLESSEEKYKMLIELAPDAFFQGDINGNFILVNNKAVELTGYSRDELYKMNVRDLFGREVLSQTPLRYDLLLEGATIKSERTLQQKEGNTITIEMNSRRMPDGTYQSFIRDITIRKKAEKDLIEQKSFFEQMYLQSATSTQILDKDGWCLRINPKLSQLFGVRPENIEGKTYNIFKDKEIVANGIDKILRRVVEEKTTERWEVKFDIGNAADSQNIDVASRSTKWFANKAYPILDIYGFVEYLIIQHEDITEKKQAEEKLFEMHEIFHHFLTKNPVYVYIKDKNLNVVHVSDNFSKLFNISTSEIIGHRSTRFLPKEIADRIDQQDRKVLNENISCEYSEENNGRFYYTHKFPIEINGEVKYIAGFSLDITEREKAKFDIIQAKEKAENANKAKTVFLANMSHELRTPLVGILGYSEMLMAEATDKVQKEMASGINRTGRRLLNTLSLVLDLSRIEAERYEINIDYHDVILLLREIFVNFKGGAALKNLTYSFKSHVEECNIKMDPEMFRIIFDNIFSNAIKFTREGKVDVITSEQQINNKKYINITISDTGIGMEEEEIPLIFEEFKQLSEGTTREFPGTGLGLSITKKLVEMLDGLIEVKSEKGIGTEFIIYFPL